MNEPKIGIVAPIYNVAPYLRECLDSIKNQTYGNFHCVLVDDGSTDDGLQIALEYAASDSRFVVITKENGGQSSARNAGIEYFCSNVDFQNPRVENGLNIFDASAKDSAKSLKENLAKPYFQNLPSPGALKQFYARLDSEKNSLDSQNPANAPQIDFIAFIDPDDYWELDCLESSLSAHTQMGSDSEIIWFKHRHFYDDVERKHLDLFFDPLGRDNIYGITEVTKIDKDQWMSFVVSRPFQFWWTWNGIIKFDLIKNNENLRFLNALIHQDCHFGTILFLSANKITIQPKVLYHYRTRPNSTSTHYLASSEKKAKSPSPYIQKIYGLYKSDSLYSVKKAFEDYCSIAMAMQIWEYAKAVLDSEKMDLFYRGVFKGYLKWAFLILRVDEDPFDVRKYAFELRPIARKYGSFETKVCFEFPTLYKHILAPLKDFLKQIKVNKLQKRIYLFKLKLKGKNQQRR